METLFSQLGKVVSGINMTRRIMNDLKETRTFMDEERLYLMQLESAHQSRFQLLRRREGLLKNTIGNSMKASSPEEIKAALDKAILKAARETPREAEQDGGALGDGGLDRERDDRSSKMDVNALEGIIRDMIHSLRIPGINMHAGTPGKHQKKKEDNTGPELKKQRTEKKNGLQAKNEEPIPSTSRAADAYDEMPPPPPSYEEAANMDMNKPDSGLRPRKKISFELKPMRSNSGFDPTKNILYDIAENAEENGDDETTKGQAVGGAEGGAKGGARGEARGEARGGARGDGEKNKESEEENMDYEDIEILNIVEKETQKGGSETGTIPKKHTTQQQMREVFPEVVLEEHDFTDDEDDSFASVDICTSMKRRDAASDVSGGEDDDKKKNEPKAKKQDEPKGKGYQKE